MMIKLSQLNIPLNIRLNIPFNIAIACFSLCLCLFSNSVLCLETTVLWLMLEQDGNKKWVSGDSEPEIVAEIETIAKEKNLSIIFPLYDLTDTTLLSTNEVANSANEVANSANEVANKNIEQNIDAFKKASERYEADCLTGVIKGNNGGWLGQWTFLKEGKTKTWETKGSALFPMMQEVLLSLKSLNELKSNNLVKNKTLAGTGNVSLTILGVTNEDHYIKILEYLQSLPYVAQVEVLEISGNKTVFNLLTTASQQELMQSISAGRVLKNVNNIKNDHQNINSNHEGLTYKMAEFHS